MSSPPVSELQAYLPRYQLARLAARGTLPSGFVSETGFAAALFVDVTGFTEVTHRTASQGPAGAEILSGALNQYFGRVTDIITACGGDVVFFAGDAALAIWPVEVDEMPAAIASACRAGLRICDELFGFTPVDGISLQQRACVGAGGIEFSEVGGMQDRWLPVTSGEAIEQAVNGSVDLAPGITAITRSAAQLCSDLVATDALTTGLARVANVRDVAFASRSAPATAGDNLLIHYIPEAVVSRLRAGHAAWLAEFREVTIAFIGLEFDATPAGRTAALHAAVASMQTTLLHFGGSVYQLVVDDKGTTLIAAFGLPPVPPENAAARAVDAVTNIARDLDRAGVRTSIGVTTGRAFCGPYGASYRQQYTVVGAVINLAARLMQASKGAILCDSVTTQRAGARFQFGNPRELAIKGNAEPVSVAEPSGRADASPVHAAAPVGRSHECDILASAVGRVAQGGGSAILVLGEAGIGKSMLTHYVLRRAAGVRVVRGAGDAVESSTAYFAFQPIIRDLLTSPSQTPAQVLTEQLATDARLLAWAPLMSSITPIDVPESELTRAMPNEARAEGVKSIVRHLVQRAAAQGPLAIFVDDLHWLDSNSLDLCVDLWRTVPGIALIFGSRPPDESSSPVLRRIVDSASLTRVDLDVLPPEAVGAIAARRLGADTLPDAIARLIVERAEGHPFYAEELAVTLLETGVLRVVDRQVILNCTEAELVELSLPSSIQGVITSRIDRLTPTAQLALKTASVVGRVFAYELLSEVYPVPVDRPQLPSGLHQLERADLAIVERPDPELSYLFKHVITQEVTYGGLPFAQRRDLHRSIAEWYEHRRHDLRPYDALLAHHWDRAGAPTRAIDYYELAGEAAVRSFANREAILFLTRALELAAAAQTDSDTRGRLRRARWERLLGDANIKLSDYDAARVHMTNALALLGQPLPAGAVATTADLLRQIARQISQRRKAKTFEPRGAGEEVGVEQEAGREVAAAYKRLGEVAWFNDRKLDLLHATFAGLNNAEASGAVAEIINGYGSVAIVAGLAGRKPIADAYLERCIELGARSGNPNHRARSDLLVAVYSVPVGDWPRAIMHAEQGAQTFAQLGDRFRWECLRALRGYVHLCVGETADADACWNEVLDSARNGALQSRVFASCGALATALQCGSPLDALMADVEELIARKPQAGDRIYCHGVLAAACARSGAAHRAFEHCTAAFELMGRTPPSTYYALWGVAGIAEVCVTQLAHNDTPATHKRARSAVKLLDAFARMIPIGQPMAALWAGALEDVRGNHDAARKRWEQGSAVASKMGMRLDADLLRNRLANTPNIGARG